MKFNPSEWTMENIQEKIGNLYKYKENVTFMSANIHKNTLGNYTLLLKMGVPNMGIKVVQGDNASLMSLVDQVVERAGRLLSKLNKKEHDYKPEKLVTLT